MITAFALIFWAAYMCWIGWLIYKGHREQKQFEKELQMMAEERRQALRWQTVAANRWKALTPNEQAAELDRAVETLRRKR